MRNPKSGGDRNPERGQKVRNPRVLLRRRGDGQGLVGPLRFFAADQQNFESAGLFDDFAGYRTAAPQPPPIRLLKSADDELGAIKLAGVGEQLAGHVLALPRGGLPAELLGQAQSLADAILFFLGACEIARGFHMQGDPIDGSPFGQTFCGPHQPGAQSIGADANQNALAGRPRTGDRVGAHVIEHLRVDAFGGVAHRQFPQSGQIAALEEALDGAARLFRDIDLAFGEALQKVVRRQIDELDFVGFGENRIGHGFAHPNAGNALDDVVQAFEMLRIQRGIDVDAGGQDIFDVLMTFQVASARHIGVGELIDEDDFGTARQDRFEIHLLEHLAAIVHGFAGYDVETLDQTLGLAPSMGFDDADDDIHTFALALLGRLQHGVGLADAGSGPEKDFQPAAILFLRSREKRIGIGAIGSINIGHNSPILSHPQCAGNWSSTARLSFKTLTRGSPKTPRNRPWVESEISWRSLSSPMPRALATRGT